jgi:hypothetical protein
VEMRCSDCSYGHGPGVVRLGVVCVGFVLADGCVSAGVTAMYLTIRVPPGERPTR